MADAVYEQRLNMAVEPDTAVMRVQSAVEVPYGSAYVIGSGLKLDAATNTLSVDTTDKAEQDNSKPITSAAVYAEVGNINALLATI